ncbi:hypothetical protein [Pacificoceanicola onchidii]|nr:hypothetical protein [Pacificoceanicola onchidii]
MAEGYADECHVSRPSREKKPTTLRFPFGLVFSLMVKRWRASDLNL